MENKKIIIFSIITFLVLVLSFGYVFYGKAAVYRESSGSEFGEV